MLAAIIGGCTAAEEAPSEGALQQAEIIEVTDCRPTIGNGQICVNPLEGGGDGRGGGGSQGGEGGPGGPGGPGPGGGGETVPEVRMAPEPDRKKDFKSCWDWCAWSWRQ